MDKVKIIFAAVLLPLVSLFLLLPFQSPDAYWPLQKFIGVILASICSLVALWGWGSILAKKILGDDDLEIAFPVGSLALALFLFFCGCLGLLGKSWAPVFFLLQIGGIYFAILAWQKWPDGKRNSWPIWIPVILLVPFVLVLNPDGDPLYYNLLSARRFYDSGKIFFDPDHPLLFLAGLWDCLYLWPISWLSLSPGEELIYQQLAGQFLTFFIGWAGSYFLLRRILLKASSLSPENATWVACLGLLNLKILYVAITAKNDWGIILWVFSAIYLFLQEKKEVRFLAGIFLGAAISSKLTVLFGVWALFLFFAISFPRRALLPLIFGMLIGALPIFARNFYFTGYPLFPMMGSALLSVTDQELFQIYGPKLAGLKDYFENIYSLLFCLPLLLLIPGISFLKEKKIILRALFVWGFFALAYALILNPLVGWRTSNILLIFGSVGGAFVLVQLLQRFELFSRRLILLFTCILFATFALREQWPLLRWLGEQPAVQIRDHLTGDAMAFARMQENSFPIGVAGNTQLFYLSHLPAFTIESSKKFDQVINGDSPLSLLKEMRRHQLRWFVETKAERPFGRASFMMWEFAEKYPDSIAFPGVRGRVLDLEKLEKHSQEPGFIDPKISNGAKVIPKQY